ncbi:O-antigen ligase family protein [Paenibacillus humicola]|uniref:O-antigen ligase family protein n=1 Tax=Paenibacillus humicola TaxID=3110540 RepID=UPI00237C368C|nr:O-antigen ligase family protein [Paenibacillus humicola]
MVKAEKNNYAKIFVFLFSIIVLVDSINGIYIEKFSGNISIGQIFRVFIFIIMFSFILKFHEKKRVYFVLFFILYLNICELGYFFNHGSLSGLLTDIQEGFRPLLVVVIIEAYRALEKKGLISGKQLMKVMKINFLLFPLSIIIPKLLDSGTNVYGDGSGYKAFYNANNDLNIVLLVLLVFAFEKLSAILNDQKKSMYYGILILLLLITLLLIGSKSSIVFSVIILFVYIFRNLIKNNFSNNLKIISISVLVIISVTYLLTTYFQNEVMQTVERFNYFFKTDVQMDNNVGTFLLTGRDVFLKAAITAFTEKITPLKLLFGQGYYEHMNTTGKVFGRPYLIVEMDFFDFFFSYGIIGSIIFYGYFIALFFKSLSKHGVHYFSAYFSYIIVAIYSFFGGHVMFSALSGSFLAITCCFLISNRNVNDSIKNKAASSSLIATDNEKVNYIEKNSFNFKYVSK